MSQPRVEQRSTPKPKATGKPKPKTNTKPTTKKNGGGTDQRVAGRGLPAVSRQQATSPDTLLLAGGLALFVLVLADTVFLTLSTRVLRAR